MLARWASGENQGLYPSPRGEARGAIARAVEQNHSNLRLYFRHGLWEAEATQFERRDSSREAGLPFTATLIVLVDIRRLPC